MPATPPAFAPLGGTAPVIALTGGSGFIGQAVARELRRRGLAVRALARRPAPALRDLGVELVPGSLGDGERLRHLVAGATAVVHCAGAIKARNANEMRAVNVEGTGRLLAAMADQPTPPRAVFVSSLAAREPALSVYAASKHDAERLLRDHCPSLEHVIVRPPAVYGPGDRTALPLFRQLGQRLALIPGTPDARFSLLFVDDLAVLLADLAQHGGGRSGAIIEPDDGTFGGYRWPDVVQVAATALRRRIKPVFVPHAALRLPVAIGQGMTRLIDRAPLLTIGKLRELFHPDWVCQRWTPTETVGWRPRWSFREGFPVTWTWYRRQGWL